MSSARLFKFYTLALDAVYDFCAMRKSLARHNPVSARNFTRLLDVWFTTCPTAMNSIEGCALIMKALIDRFAEADARIPCAIAGVMPPSSSHSRRSRWSASSAPRSTTATPTRSRPRMQAGARCDRADAVEGRRQPDQRAAADHRDRLFQGAVHPARSDRASPSPRPTTPVAAHR